MRGLVSSGLPSASTKPRAGPSTPGCLGGTLSAPLVGAGDPGRVESSWIPESNLAGLLMCLVDVAAIAGILALASPISVLSGLGHEPTRGDRRSS